MRPAPHLVTDPAGAPAQNSQHWLSARHHYEHALALYTELGMPEADQVRARLTTLAPSSTT